LVVNHPAKNVRRLFGGSVLCFDDVNSLAAKATGTNNNHIEHM
jgi:hypothetical protein